MVNVKSHGFLYTLCVHQYYIIPKPFFFITVLFFLVLIYISYEASIISFRKTVGAEMYDKIKLAISKVIECLQHVQLATVSFIA